MTEIKGPLLIPPESGMRGEGSNRKFYESIPEDVWNTMKDDFTQNGQIEIIKWFKDESFFTEQQKWSNEKLLKFKQYYNTENIVKKQNNQLSLPEEYNEPYNEWRTPVSVFLNYIFLKYENKIRGKKIAIIGSLIPWIEGMCLNYDPKIIRTVEYNLPKIDNDSLIEVQLYDDFCKCNDIFDVIIQFSSIEHSGLGRYGDNIDPNADLKTMDQIYNHLTDDGLLIWGSPVHGKDYIGWNVHRVYGPLRLPLMFKKFEELEWIPKSKEEIMSDTRHTLLQNQPVIILKKNNNI